jgi:diguanylate cyclase (GGDEF)-like protein
VLVFGGALVAAIGVADYLTGPELAFQLFYLAPVAIVSWRCAMRAGLLAAALSGIVGFGANLAAGETYSAGWIGGWDLVVRITLYLIIAYILFALRRDLRHEHDVARTDQLTGIPNARYFYEAADREIARARRQPRPISMLYLDCDDFKRVNDQLGHWAGDRLLRMIAATLAQAVRRTDVVARIGGDEFAILLPETDAAGARVAAEKVTEELDEVIGKGEWSATFSMGGVTFEALPPSVDVMLREADRRMYEVKRSGKNATRLEVIGFQASSPA